MRAAFVTVLLCGFAPAADPPKAGAPPEWLAGAWVETSVRYAGEDLIEPPSTSNLMSFDGLKFTERTPSGKPLLRGEIKVVGSTDGVYQIDLPHKVIADGKVKTVTVAAIVRPVGKDGMQIAYFEPGAVPPGKRPLASESTKGVVLITLKRAP